MAKKNSKVEKVEETKATAVETQGSQDEKLPDPAPANETGNTGSNEQASPETNAPEGGQKAQEEAQGEPQNEQAAPDKTKGPEEDTEIVLFSLGELEQKYRVPGWQAAALSRLMGWEAGKVVSAKDYETALDQLNNRRQGGGRR